MDDIDNLRRPWAQPADQIAQALGTAHKIAMAVYLPGLSDALNTVDPGVDGWALVLGASLLPLLIGQIIKTIRSDSTQDTTA